MNKPQPVETGDLYKIKDLDYRVFYAQQGIVGVICMQKIIIRSYTIEDFSKRVMNGEYQKEEESVPAIAVPLPEETKKAIDLRAETMNELLEDICPRWDNLCKKGHREHYLYDAAEKAGLTVDTFRRQLYSYMRSGLDKTGLIDGRSTKRFNQKPESPVPLEMIDEKTGLVDRNYALEWGWQRFNENKPAPVSKAYDDMLDEFYMTYDWESMPGGGLKPVAKKDEHAPSYDALDRYIKKRLQKGETIKDFKNGQREWQNNHRPLTGTGRSGLISCGQRVQADECEFDVELRDENGRAIGKPIVYCLFDPYTQIIVSLWVGLSNNSIDGPVNLLLSMCEPHENQTKVCGVDCTEEEFPSGFLPKEILCDQGSEYMSAHMKKMTGELGITLSPVPAATGSDKGGVESVFHRLQSRLQKLIFDKGYIRHTHDGAKEARDAAVLSLEGFKTICYRMVIELNTTLIGDTYSPDRDALEAGVKPIPSELWKFYTKEKIAPSPVTDRNRTQVMYSLLWRDKKFKVSRKGIECIGTNLSWFDESDWFRELMYSDNPVFEVRYDKTDIVHVYVKYKDVIHQITFSPARDDLNSYRGWTWPAYEDYWKEYQKARKEEKTLSTEKRLATYHASKEIVKQEQAARGKSEARKINSKDSVNSSRALKRAQQETSPDETKNRLLNVHQKEELPEEKPADDEQHEEDPIEELLKKPAIDFTEDDLLALILAQEDDD